MTFVIDTDLISNDEVKITENSNGTLEIIHVGTNNKIKIDSDTSLSELGTMKWE
jgi:hypothetical protein